MSNVSLWSVPNNTNLGTFEENVFTSIDLPVNNDAEIFLLSGNLPLGLRIENKKIIGTPNEVARPTTSKFVLRAELDGKINDRTFYILIEGEDPPEWLTPAGSLGVGPNNVLFVLDNTIIDYSLLATDPDLPAGDILRYYVSKGELPTGLELTEDGRIFGIVDPLLSLKFNILGGYDTTQLDLYPYDFAYDEPDSRIPKKLNRNFEFEVTVTDNVTAVKRLFSIFVVGDDFARADNTIMKAANGVFTADFTYLRTPVWLTPSNLGQKRANNYITIYLDAYDSNELRGNLKYVLEPLNDDGSPSEIPPGLNLDSETGELAGIVPYQPNITKNYKFTVNAVRYTDEDQLITTFRNFYDDVLAGSSIVRLAKLPEAFTLGIDLLQALIGRSIVIENEEYIVVSANGSNSDYDTITLSRGLTPSTKNNSLTLFKSAIGGDKYFFVNSLTETDRRFYLNKTLVYNFNEIYRIDDVFAYLKYVITSPDPIYLTNNIDSSTIETDLQNILNFDNRTSEVIAERDGNNNVTQITMLVPSNFQTRSVSYIKSLFSNTNLTVIKTDDIDRVELNTTLTRSLSTGSIINIAVVKTAGFNKTFSVEQEITLEKKKTFNLKLLGNVDSEITWLTPGDLGTLNSNRISTLFVKAVSSIPDTKVTYTISQGFLPFGLTLSTDGEIIGKVPVIGTVDKPGLTFIDNGTTTFDNNTTTIDREFKFTILAEDRFKYSGLEKEFIIKINDQDRLEYCSFYMKPFMKLNQRESFRNLINNSSIFDPRKIYRLNDPSFGLQKEPTILAYSGIERRAIDEFVAAASQNHKKRNFYLGDVKTAVAKIPGTNTILYEIVYVEVVDRSKPSVGLTQKSFYTKSTNKITVDQTKIEQTDGYRIDNRETFRYRPETNIITADINSVKVDQRNGILKYITNIDNMRNQIRDMLVGNRKAVTNREFLPLWMRTPQEGSLTELGFVLALPLAYTLPGESQTIKENIENDGFDFKTLDFEIDRYVVDSTFVVDQEQYLLFANYKFNV
jgi:hypothetical protein